jgi:prevent-host-death family protein
MKTTLRINMMNWQVAEAKQKFSEVLRVTAVEPQLIFNRGRLVAAMIDAQLYEAFQAWYEQQHRPTLAEAFTSLRQLCSEEGYTLNVATRRDRQNAFVKDLDDVSL